MEFEFPFRAERGFDGLYGLEVTEASDRLVKGVVAISDDLRQAAGLVHGGVYASIAESLASIGTHLVVRADGKYAVGLANQTSFLRPITRGAIHAQALVRHRGRTTWVWDVEIEDDEGRLCVITRMTIAVREAG